MRWIVAIAAGTWLAGTAAAGTRCLSGFEDDRDVDAWQPHHAEMRRVASHVTEGRHALELKLAPARYPGLRLEGSDPRLRGWDRFESLRLDVYSADPRPVSFTVRIDDAASRGYGSRFNDEFLLRPGWNRLEYPVRRLLTTDKSRALDPARLRRLMLFANELARPLTLYVDNVRLETAAAVAGNGEVWALDFGPPGAPVMAGFQPVAAADDYRADRGWGWTGGSGRCEYDNELPDALGRDLVSGPPDQTYTNTFRIDLPDGEYEVTVCGQSLAGGLAFVPARSYRIAAEGRMKVEVPISAGDFYSSRILFRGIDHNWWPGQDVWTEEVRDRLPEHTLAVTVADGRLDLAFDTMAVYWVAVHSAATPTADRISWRERVRAEQRRQFHDRYFYLAPYRPAPNPVRRSAHLARGQETTVFLNADTPPEICGLAALRPRVRAVRLMPRPWARGVYGIDPTVLVPLAQCPHPTRFAVTLRGDRPGRYRGRIGTTAVEVRVWPITLPAAADLDVTIGWYYAEGGLLNYFRPLFPDRAGLLRELRDRELEDMAAHGANSLLLEAPAVRPDGSLDTAAADDLLAAGRRAGLVGNRPVLMTSLWIARRLARELGVAESSPRFFEVFPSCLANLRAWATARGVTLVANVVDEPREQALNPWNRNYADTRQFLELYRAAEVRSMVTVTGDESFGKNYVPLAGMMDVVAVHPTRSSQGLIEASRRLGRERWHYNAGMNRLSYGFHLWASGAKGRWEWHYQWWQQAYDPFARVDESPWSPGWGAVRPSPAGPVPTEAYERVRAGIDDYRFLYRLEQVLRQRTGPTAGAARDYLEGIRGRLPQFLGEGRDVGEATLDEWRGKIAGLIVALEGETD
ncbi:hypothetical protein HQ590_04985 [bacterium]|nr:hypothetical protein [bacterium]